MNPGFGNGLAALQAAQCEEGPGARGERIEELTIRYGDNVISGTMHYPDDGLPVHPLVIMSHGFGGAHWPRDEFAGELARQGYLCYGFDFCGGGPLSRSSGSTTGMSVLTEVDDLNAVLDALAARDDVDPRRICLFGRSQGGFVSAYVAAKRPRDVRALVMFFPAFVIHDDARKRLGSQGGFPETCDVAGVTVGRMYGEDALSFDIYDVMGGYDGKVLIVHGDADEVVPLSYSQRAMERYRDAELVVLPGQGHGFREGGNPIAGEIAMRFLNAAMGVGLAESTPGD